MHNEEFKDFSSYFESLDNRASPQYSLGGVSTIPNNGQYFSNIPEGGISQFYTPQPSLFNSQFNPFYSYSQHPQINPFSQFSQVNTRAPSLILQQQNPISQNHGDRFIPFRGYNHNANLVNQESSSSGSSMDCNDSDSENSFRNRCKCNYKSLLSESLLPNEIAPRILNFKKNKEEADLRPSLIDKVNGVYQKAQENIDLKKKNKRIIPKHPEKILDAPELVNDYYLNLIDWGSKNLLAVCLGQTLYLWKASTGEIETLTTKQEAGNILTSVAFSENGRSLALGTNNKTIEIWDIESKTQKHILHGHTGRVCSLSWNPSPHFSNILSSGSQDTFILTHDLRLASPTNLNNINPVSPYCSASSSSAATRCLVNRQRAHNEEVCGLKWNHNGMELASGGNDNILCIWDIRNSHIPRFKFTQHEAAVKAIGWCPWENALLATGGGTDDKCIRFWDTQKGLCVKCIKTDSQVCALLWNPPHRELITSHGYNHFQITLWSYNSIADHDGKIVQRDLVRVKDLRSHKNRVLCLNASPDGSTIVSAGADETLRFWKINEGAWNSNKDKEWKDSVINGINLR